MFHLRNPLTGFLLIMFYVSVRIEGFHILRRRLSSISQTLFRSGDDPSEPLFLTPSLETCQIELALNSSQVYLEPAHSFSSNSGYLTISRPGASSLFGLFSELGTIQVDEAERFHSSNIAWNSKYHLPLSINRLALNIALLPMIDAMCTLKMNEYASCDFYAVGESYGGKYVSAIVNKIYIENHQAKLKNNLEGMAIGDDLVDAYNHADRIIWKVKEDDQDVAGYLKRAHSFFLAWVRNAGHSVPYEQPRVAFELIDRFISAS
ncbi:unnamed protein product [Rotaria socialis]|uniref:Carboxypeptidase n=1 Tax=Rotaria socialis TaxID=392032 RepID=A0A818G5E9_9BILA|nr:unnamed protein product [Rotaria socialis]